MWNRNKAENNLFDKPLEKRAPERAVERPAPVPPPPAPGAPVADAKPAELPARSQSPLPEYLFSVSSLVPPGAGSAVEYSEAGRISNIQHPMSNSQLKTHHRLAWI